MGDFDPHDVHKSMAEMIITVITMRIIFFMVYSSLFEIHRIGMFALYHIGIIMPRGGGYFSAKRDSKKERYFSTEISYGF